MSRLRVLIVEDDPAYAAMVGGIINTSPEFIVAAVESSSLGVSAWRTFDGAPLAVAIVDYHLAGGEDGVAVAELLRSLEGPDLLIVGLTGEADPAVHEEMRRAGADVVFEKSAAVGVLLEGLLRRKERSRAEDHRAEARRG